MLGLLPLIPVCGDLTAVQYLHELLAAHDEDRNSRYAQRPSNRVRPWESLQIIDLLRADQVDGFFEPPKAV
jgi:hypothetical protein